MQDQKCNVNERDFDGASPLHYAASLGHAEVVRWLLTEGGAKVTLDNLGGSPLHNAAEVGCLKVHYPHNDRNSQIDILERKKVESTFTIVRVLRNFDNINKLIFLKQKMGNHGNEHVLHVQLHVCTNKMYIINHIECQIITSFINDAPGLHDHHVMNVSSYCLYHKTEVI